MDSISTAVGGSESSQGATKVRVEIHADPTVNYASYQNNVQVACQ
jgi:hypothetical protein